MTRAKLLLITALLAVCACNGNGTDTPGDIPEDPQPVFARGADASWVTEMEASGKSFYDANGQKTECFALLKSLGFNAIRLRVWVNPANGYNGLEDVVAKAVRAKNLGLPVMVDFHYSDSWADPGQQYPPAAWKDYDLERMAKAVSDHTTAVLNALKDKGVQVDWVQTGNETPTGMLWPLGSVSEKTGGSGFATLANAGYNASKAVFPKAKVLLHIDNGYDLGRTTWFLDLVKQSGAKWDVIGLSLYPDEKTWESYVKRCTSNMMSLANTYKCETMVCEVGAPWNATWAGDFLSAIVQGARNTTGCLGVFYWEPECYGNWNGYTKGAFDNSGKPTAALGAFAQ